LFVGWLDYMIQSNGMNSERSVRFIKNSLTQ
jgi:hypothetical protein